MKIEKYVLNSYNTVNPFTATILVEEKILEKGYVVVIDEENTFYGILTTCDLIKRPHKLVADCLTKKENLYLNDTVFSSFDKFYTSQSPALPVFKEDKFLGIVEKQKIVFNLKNKIQELFNKSVISQNLKESFLNNLSHEIRTPLNGLLGFLEIVSNLILEDEKEVEDTYYNIIRKSADRLLLILNDLIDLSLLNSGDNLVIEISEINIETIFSDLKQYFDMERLISKKEISVDYVNPDTSLVLSTDGKKIKHILYHLIDNAIKFSFDHGKVLYGYKIENKTVVFFVKNNGSQISEDKKTKVFEIFEKQNYQNNELVDGLGIGLPLVKRLSELLNGKIELVSKETETTFFCTIPLK